MRLSERNQERCLQNTAKRQCKKVLMTADQLRKPSPSSQRGQKIDQPKEAGLS
jgi:hypothetical protein